MSTKTLLSDNQSVLRLIWGISIIIPVAVAILIFKPQLLTGIGEWVNILPHINAVINSATTFILVFALVAVKTGNIVLHKRLMLTAFVLGALFLVSYVIYHSAAVHTVYGDVNYDGKLSDAESLAIGGKRSVFLIILLSHILFSIGVLPVVLFAFFYALTDRIEAHRRIVRIAFPIWLYVSVTGVIVYLMISPYYA